MTAFACTVCVHGHSYRLSNAMRGQNINLPVCVCVCVCLCVTLSVNSSTGQTPQRIFKRLTLR